jgi:hypothetical protein
MTVTHPALAKFNYIAIGIIAGIIFPVITFILVYHYNIRTDVTFDYFLTVMIQGKMVSKLLAICVVPNLAPFFIAIWLNLLKTARGVLFTTIVLGVTSAILSFVL